MAQFQSEFVILVKSLFQAPIDKEKVAYQRTRDEGEYQGVLRTQGHMTSSSQDHVV